MIWEAQSHCSWCKEEGDMSVLMERLVGRSRGALVSGFLPAELVMKGHWDAVRDDVWFQRHMVWPRYCELNVLLKWCVGKRIWWGFFPPPKLLIITYFCLIFFFKWALKEVKDWCWNEQKPFALLNGILKFDFYKSK